MIDYVWKDSEIEKFPPKNPYGYLRYLKGKTYRM